MKKTDGLVDEPEQAAHEREVRLQAFACSCGHGCSLHGLFSLAQNTLRLQLQDPQTSHAAASLAARSSVRDVGIFGHPHRTCPFSARLMPSERAIIRQRQQPQP